MNNRWKDTSVALAVLTLLVFTGAGCTQENTNQEVEETTNDTSEGVSRRPVRGGQQEDQQTEDGEEDTQENTEQEEVAEQAQEGDEEEETQADDSEASQAAEELEDLAQDVDDLLGGMDAGESGF